MAILNDETSTIVPSAELQAGTEKLLGLLNERLALQPPDEPLFLFIAGRSGAGKTAAVSTQILERFGENDVYRLKMDDYFVGDTALAELQKTKPYVNWDHPEYLDVARLQEDLQALQKGESITKPHFNFNTGEPDEETETVDPKGKKIIIVEGIHALNEHFASIGGVRTFVDISLHGSFVRRLIRDVQRTSMTPSQIVRTYLEVVDPMYQQHVVPTKAHADIVIRNEYDPHIEARRTGLEQNQVKFATDLTPDDLQRRAIPMGEADQIDYYFVPHEGEVNDEIVRIRHQNGTYYLTYKGPRQEGSSTIERPIFVSVIDEKTAELLLKKKEYGPILRTIAKTRHFFIWEGITFTHDTVFVINEEDERPLGPYIEVHLSTDKKRSVEQLHSLRDHLELSGDPIAIPYIVMAQ